MQASFLVMGDLHGRYDLLQKALNEVAPQASEGRLVFLGDYIDRGPDSAALLERLIELKQKRPDSIMLMGNHEKVLLELLDSPNHYWTDSFLLNGGQATLDSYGLSLSKVRKIPASHQQFLRGLPLYHLDADYLFVHAGLRPGIPLEQQKSSDLLTIRHDFFNSSYPFKPIVVFGHTAFPRPFLKKYCLGIDTGAVYGQYLTCALLPQMRFFKVS